MRYKLFGRSGLRVAELALGTMTFGAKASRDVARSIFDAYVQTGGNFIDTANIYARSESEKIVGELLQATRDQFVLATKYSGTLSPADPNAQGNHRKNLIKSVEHSLRRLKTDYIDLLWVHMFDGSTPAEEVMHGLDHLVQQGKVLYVGASDWPAWTVAHANTLAQLRGWTPFAGLQIEYSLVQRAPERELIPMAEAFGLTVAAWSPLGGGLLTDRYTNDDELKELTTKRAEMLFSPPEKLKSIAEEVRSVAKTVGKNPAQVALNWLRRRGAIPILGASSLEQIQDSLGALEWQLTPEQAERLDNISAIQLGYPNDFLTSAPVRKGFYGGETKDKIDWRPPTAF